MATKLVTTMLDLPERKWFPDGKYRYYKGRDNVCGFINFFGVFDYILKCPECGDEMKSHVDMTKKVKKHRHAHYISLQCVECGWKYCFDTSKKQGQSYEINVRAVLGFRKIGKGHSAMTTLSKVLNIPAPPTTSSKQKASTGSEAVCK